MVTKISITLFSDGTRITSTSSDKTVRIWDASNGACLQILEVHGRSGIFDADTLGAIARKRTPNIQEM